MKKFEDRKTNVDKLIEKAAKSLDSNDAMKFSQAALNAANAICSMVAAAKSIRDDQLE